jgi:hypothetical protein
MLWRYLIGIDIFFSSDENRALIVRTPFDIPTIEPLILKLSFVVIVSGRADLQASNASTIAQPKRTLIDLALRMRIS